MKINRKRSIKMLFLTVVMGLLASACYTSYAVVYDPHKALAAEWYAAITVEKGYPTACVTAYSTAFSGSGWQCRSVHGVEAAGDNHNWFVDPGGEGDLSNEGILSKAGSSDSSKGVTLVMDDGKIFEGCQWRSPDNTWFCDYYSVLWSAPFKTTQGYDYLLATKDWGLYVLDTLACAGALTGTLMYGQKWTVTMLKDCASGPL